tara:strand:- start:287 stop:520 length:234 start_codon:yes stop_codon:yes gene_type:complete
MKKLAKLKRDVFHDKLRDELITMSEFAEKIGTHESYLSRLSSSAPSGCRCERRFVRRVLEGFCNKYKFDDLFFWVNY